MLGTPRREFLAEFLGTFVLMFFGLAVNAQVTLGKSVVEVGEDGSRVVQSDFGGWLSLNIGWGLAVVMGVYVAGGITGAHINPAVTLAMAVRRQFPFAKVPGYVVAQLAGAFIAALLVYVVYYEAINAVELQTISATGETITSQDAPRTMKTAGIFGTYPHQFANGRELSWIGGLLDQIAGTAMLLLCIFALADKRNLAPQSNLGPLFVGCIVLLIGISFGMNCGYAINPARDLGPRLFTLIGGWGGQVFSHHAGMWWLVPILGPCIGGVIGATAYDVLIKRYHDTGSALSGS